MDDPQTRRHQRIQRLVADGGASLFADNRIGLEKESLRVSPSGRLAATPHPMALGAALCHPYMTTDFSEALVELITPPLNTSTAALAFLQDIHGYVYRHLGDERLWTTSMPCALETGQNIPLAHYGTSNAATMKTVYRRGLGNRYGRTMQLIAGVHFNFSFAETFWERYQTHEADAGEPLGFRSEAQMDMIRNLQRRGWLVPYLFGASPAVCASFVQGRATELQRFDDDTLYLPDATSLRMGDIGYQNKQEEGTGIKANYDSLDSYVRSLTWAIQTPCPQYENIGVKVGNRYEQLNANVLQIENEYYSTVRPKQVTDWLEKPTLALRRRGIRYVELRSLDVNLFEPLGVGSEQLLFLEVLLLDCLLLDSPRIGAAERREIDTNQILTAHHGRKSGLHLAHERQPVMLSQWADEILDGMAAVAELLDGAADGPRSVNLRRQKEKITHPELTPSAQILEMMRDRREGFCELAQRFSGEHRQTLLRLPLNPEHQALFDQLARDSLRQQQAIEAADNLGFDDFLSAYFTQGQRASGQIG